jgi:hydrogenase maturation protein HypF
MTAINASESALINVFGVVQGVGFRPFVYQLAHEHGLTGWVCNTSEDVKIEVEGGREAIDRFYSDLIKRAPPLARIENTSLVRSAPKHYKVFEIRQSVEEADKYQLISPDIATCDACVGEIHDRNDRRYRYPFTNCTNCGPRFTIIEDIPYDRPRTTMRDFQMCPACQAEYDNPLDRRFHAQPNACPVCGPRLKLLDCNGTPVATTDAIAKAVQLIREGNIVAVKGLGGFLLACDATNDEVVTLLRKRKQRPSKPFAIMVRDMSEAQRHCTISAQEAEVLASPQSPIVLLQWKMGSSVCYAVAPNMKSLGVMLPYTPLHHILLRETGIPLVMTSGNLSEEPIAGDNDEAVRRLSGIADYFLVHNRDIYARYDDSVVEVERDGLQIVRRARGYAPFPVKLNFETGQVFGCGADEKNTFCFIRDGYAFLSQHIGDMENLETVEHYTNTIKIYKKLFRVEPEVIAHDLHPAFFSTQYAFESLNQAGDKKLVPVQHHHAHIVSCMVDNSIEQPVIGVALDGTGYGADEHIWGGEFMVADYRGFTRMGHLEYLPLPGGDAAIRRPYRIAVSYLISLLGDDSLTGKLPFLEKVDPAELGLIKRQVRSGINSSLTSSMGRLFDAVSALIGVRDVIDYEAQAAVELEMKAYESGSIDKKCYPYSISEQDGMLSIHLRDLFLSVVEDLYRGATQSTIAAIFHNTVAGIVRDMCHMIAKKTKITHVALSGGTFQNRLLLKKVVPLLESSGLTVLTHRQIPCNDGGISVGQAVIGNYS